MTNDFIEAPVDPNIPNAQLVHAARGYRAERGADGKVTQVPADHRSVVLGKPSQVMDAEDAMLHAAWLVVAAERVFALERPDDALNFEAILAAVRALWV
jgi:hypothetical protein